MVIKNVALVGAAGNLGEPILRALLSSGLFDVTVVKRRSSSRTAAVVEEARGVGGVGSSPVRVVEVDDELSFESVREALRGQDACVATFPVRDVGQHLRLAEAAAAAGVRRFVPADFGSCDSSTARAREVTLFRDKERVRLRLQELADADAKGRFAWTALVAGHFFDWGLRHGFLHFDPAARTVDLLDDGRHRSSLSTLGRVADAVVRLLRMGEEEARTANRMLFIQSFCVSQLDILASLERATGQTWTVNRIDSARFLEENHARAATGDSKAVEHLAFALGTVDGDWEKKDGFAMDLLGFKNENLDEEVAKVVAGGGW